MSDLLCAKCLEPWDAYGAAHGDMEPWEWALFQKGAGCPACTGVVPDGVAPDAAIEAHVRSIVFGAYDNPHAFALVNDSEAAAPEWEKPADEVVRKCESCGDRSRLMKIQSDGELYWDGKTYTQLHHHGNEWETAMNEPEAFTMDGKFYCPSCAMHCHSCSALTFADELRLAEGKFGSDDGLCEKCYRNEEEDGDQEDDEGSEGEAEEADEEG